MEQVHSNPALPVRVEIPGAVRDHDRQNAGEDDVLHHTHAGRPHVLRSLPPVALIPQRRGKHSIRHTVSMNKLLLSNR